MEVMVFGSTKPGYELPIDEAIKFSSYSAGVCYMSDSVEKILNEDIEKTLNRANMTLTSGHHSVYEHPNYTFVFTDIPKILAMVINNEYQYATSEKSARYTKMVPSMHEKERYDKWTEKFKELISNKYPTMDDKRVRKLAIENARYMISVFTPTTMVYTTNLRQINYIVEMMEKFIKTDTGYNHSLFYGKLKQEMKYFIEKLDRFIVNGLQRPLKNQELSIFNIHEIDRPDYFGDVYCVTYHASFAQFAQAQRHRTLDYTAELTSQKMFYVPRIIIENDALSDEWFNDLNTLPDGIYPQATLLRVTERGTYEKFILKCYERICCNAQNEIAFTTADLFRKYIDGAGDDSRIRLDHPKFEVGSDFKSKTQIPYLRCAGKCNNFGRRYAINRDV